MEVFTCKMYIYKEKKHISLHEDLKWKHLVYLTLFHDFDEVRGVLHDYTSRVVHLVFHATQPIDLIADQMTVVKFYKSTYVLHSKNSLPLFPVPESNHT